MGCGVGGADRGVVLCVSCAHGDGLQVERDAEVDAAHEVPDAAVEHSTEGIVSERVGAEGRCAARCAGQGQQVRGLTGLWV